jgi:hypothetical protein
MSEQKFKLQITDHLLPNDNLSFDLDTGFHMDLLWPFGAVIFLGRLAQPSSEEFMTRDGSRLITQDGWLRLIDTDPWVNKGFVQFSGLGRCSIIANVLSQFIANTLQAQNDS